VWELDVIMRNAWMLLLFSWVLSNLDLSVKFLLVHVSSVLEFLVESASQMLSWLLSLDGLLLSDFLNLLDVVSELLALLLPGGLALLVSSPQVSIDVLLVVDQLLLDLLLGLKSLLSSLLYHWGYLSVIGKLSLLLGSLELLVDVLNGKLGSLGSLLGGELESLLDLLGIWGVGEQVRWDFDLEWNGFGSGSLFLQQHHLYYLQSINDPRTFRFKYALICE
jgi:hypothetical protein